MSAGSSEGSGGQGKNRRKLRVKKVATPDSKERSHKKDGEQEQQPQAKERGNRRQKKAVIKGKEGSDQEQREWWPGVVESGGQE